MLYIIIKFNDNIKYITFGNYFISLTNIFNITTNKNLFSQEFCDSILLLYGIFCQ